MLGVVLCGGESKRMGSEKALLVTATLTWAEIAFNTLSAMSIPVVLSVNTKQAQYYTSILPSNKLIIDDEMLQIGGPLCGLLSIHQLYKTESILLLACDMPEMVPNVLEMLIKKHQVNSLKEAIFFSINQEPEPLCAIYTAKGLAKILKLHHANELQKHSMKYILQQMDTVSLDLPEDLWLYFKNFNSKTDLQHL